MMKNQSSNYLFPHSNAKVKQQTLHITNGEAYYSTKKQDSKENHIIQMIKRKFLYMSDGQYKIIIQN